MELDQLDSEPESEMDEPSSLLPTKPQFEPLNFDGPDSESPASSTSARHSTRRPTSSKATPQGPDDETNVEDQEGRVADVPMKPKPMGKARRFPLQLTWTSAGSVSNDEDESDSEDEDEDESDSEESTPVDDAPSPGAEIDDNDEGEQQSDTDTYIPTQASLFGPPLGPRHSDWEEDSGYIASQMS